MKVLLVVHGFPPRAIGGTEIHAASHARTLHEAYGDEVLVLAREHDPARPDADVRHETREGIRIVWVNNALRDSRSFASTYRSEVITRVAGRIIDEFRPDVAHIHHLTGLGTGLVDALASRGVPRFVTLHDYWLLCHRGQLLDTSLQPCAGPEPEGCASCLGLAGATGAVGHRAAGLVRELERRVPETLSSPVRRTAERAAAWVADANAAARESRRRLDHMRETVAKVTHFVAPSDDVRRRFLRFGIPPAKISTVPLGIDVAPFQGLSRRESSLVRFGYVGSLMVSKAPHLLIEAFRRLPSGSATLDIYGGHAAYHGDDSYRARLEPLLALPGVRWHGAMAHERVPEALASIDVLVVPSVWPETSGLVIKEAFEAGAVVVASRIGGMPESVTDGVDGLLVSPNDGEELTRALTRLVTEPGLLEALRRGVTRVRTIAEHVAGTRALYAVGPAGPKTAAIVLNYRTPDDTVLAVRSLLASRRPFAEVLVVDNDTSGECRRALRALTPTVRCVEAGGNLGFSGGMNVGIREALTGGATRLLLVNSDVYVPPDCLARLEEVLETRPDVGLVAPVVRSRAAPDVVSSLGMTYHSSTGRMRHRGAGAPLGARSLPDAQTIDAASGCVLLIRREVVDAVGLLDEDFFFGFEDLELCLRAGRAGFATALAGRATVYHEGGRSIGAESPRRLYYAARNHLLAARRAAPEAGRLGSALRGTAIVALNLAHALRARGGTVPVRLAAVMRGTLDYARGRFGPDG